MRRKQSYFEKRPLLREEHFVRTRNFYKEDFFLKKILFREENPILNRDFF